MNCDILIICLLFEVIMLYNYHLWIIQVHVIVASHKSLQFIKVHFSYDHISVPIYFQLYRPIWIKNMTLYIRHLSLFIFQWQKCCTQNREVLYHLIFNSQPSTQFTFFIGKNTCTRYQQGLYHSTSKNGRMFGVSPVKT